MLVLKKEKNKLENGKSVRSSSDWIMTSYWSDKNAYCISTTLIKLSIINFINDFATIESFMSQVEVASPPRYAWRHNAFMGLPKFIIIGALLIVFLVLALTISLTKLKVQNRLEVVGLYYDVIMLFNKFLVLRDIRTIMYHISYQGIWSLYLKVLHQPKWSRCCCGVMIN